MRWRQVWVGATAPEVSLTPAPAAQPWSAWLEELRAAGRVVLEGERWFAADSTRDPKAVLRGRLEALGRAPQRLDVALALGEGGQPPGPLRVRRWASSSRTA